MNVESKKKLSIIIPTFNRAKVLIETLNSLENQSYTDWECIIIDDQSSDNTEQIVNSLQIKDDRFKFFRRPDNLKKGANSCRNYGFTLAKGDWIHFMDSDDLYFDDALKIYSSFFSNSKDVVVAKIQVFDINSNSIIRETTIDSNNLIEDYFTNKVTFYVSGPVWNKKFLDRQNQIFDDSISNLDDWDFNLRMLYSKPNVKLINQPLIQYRVSHDSLSQEISKLNLSEIQSELFARNKHLELLSKNQDINHNQLKRFIKDRHKDFFKAAVLSNNSNKNYFFINLLKQQFKLFDFKGILKTVTAYYSYLFFKKGYKLLS